MRRATPDATTQSLSSARPVSPRSESPRAATPQWFELASAPVPSEEVASAAVGGRLYVAGGLLSSGPVKTVQIYDPNTNQWHRGRDLPVALHHPMGAAYQGRFVVAGGFIASGAPSAQVFILDPSGWHRLPRLKNARGAGGAAAIGAELFVVGGRGARDEVAQTERFDGHAWSNAAPIPTPRDHLAVASDGKAIYAVCGRIGSLNRNLNTVHRLDPSSGRWSTLPAAPTARGGIGAGVLRGKIVVVGGEGPRAATGPNGVYRQVEAFDIAKGRWSSLPDPMPRPRHGIAVGVVGFNLYVAVGGTVAGLSPSALLEALEFP